MCEGKKRTFVYTPHIGRNVRWLLEREEKTVNSLRCNKLSSLGVVFSHRPLEAYGLFTNTGEVISFDQKL